MTTKLMKILAIALILHSERVCCHVELKPKSDSTITIDEIVGNFLQGPDESTATGSVTSTYTGSETESFTGTIEPESTYSGTATTSFSESPTGVPTEFPSFHPTSGALKSSSRSSKGPSRKIHISK